MGNRIYQTRDLARADCRGVAEREYRSQDLRSPIMWRAAFALVLACVAPPAVSLSNEVRAPAHTPAISLGSRLSQLAVTDDDFYRPVLYSWTTPANIAALRKTRRLLTATATTGGFVSPLLRALALASQQPGPGRDIARMLITNPVLLRRRYAWPHPFATVLGLGDRTYGTALIRMELQPTAWIGRFDPTAAEPFSFRDARGATIDLADVLAHPERVGAIFHVRTELAVPFREYVVCNPTMVASWSVGTPEIRAELDAEVATIAAVARVATTTSASAAPAWAHGDSSGWLGQWHTALAFDNPRYRATPATLATLAAALDAYDPTPP